LEPAGDWGMRIREPYWDADLVQYLCRVPPELAAAAAGVKKVSFAKPLRAGFQPRIRTTSQGLGC